MRLLFTRRLCGVGLRRQPRRCHDERDQGKGLDLCFQGDFPPRLRLLPKKMGVTYSRSNPGTGMPLQERFRARPMWACLEPCPVSQNYQFWIGQQPKPQICCFGVSTCVFSER